MTRRRPWKMTINIRVNPLIVPGPDQMVNWAIIP